MLLIPESYTPNLKNAIAVSGMDTIVKTKKQCTK